MSIPPKYEDVVEKLDAALAREAALREELEALRESYEAMRDRKNSIVDLQQRLTASEQRAGKMEELLREAYEAGDHNIFGTDLDSRIDAALNPAEGQLNQCDGCQAGIPVVNGAHRMGKPGAYPDTMSCTAKLYKP